MAKQVTVIGLMSGTSLDGVDLACVSFNRHSNRWTYELLAAQTKPYNQAWSARLKNLMHAPANDFAAAHAELGHLLASYARAFIKKYNLRPDLIASHGHTIFHQPSRHFTSQIGDGSVLAAVTGITTICDFRTTDLAKGGQGAPLVPAGDRLLFSDYNYCLNLGGIANISYEKNKQRLAFDICPANMALNELAGQAGLAYDKGGRLAASAHPDHRLLEKLNGLAFFSKKPPKSLGAEWYLKEFKPLLDEAGLTTEEKLATVVEHIADQVKLVLLKTGTGKLKRMLVTGGGAHNRYLIGKLKEKTGIELVVPEKDLVDFKEAIVFAFLGLLRFRHEINTYHSVTGARADSCSGAVYLP